jgi:ParB family transcriptional regulator, chromosome partitioning protein
MNNLKKPTGLGRGLSALLGDMAPARAAQEVQSSDAPVSAGPLKVAIGRIYPNPKQPRRLFRPEALQELEDSIREKGLLQPILVRPSADQPGLYEIVAGERRWRAAQRVPLHELPVVVRELSDAEVMELALVENIQRQDLNPIEEAEGFSRLIEAFQYTQEKLAQMVGKSRSHVANMLRLLDLPVAVRELVMGGQLTMGHARALVSMAEPERMALEIVKGGLSVRQVEQLAKASVRKPGAAKGRPSAFKIPGDKDADTLALERDISAGLGMPVNIAFAGQKGTVTISYASLDQLDDLCQRLCAPLNNRGGF